MIFTGLLDLCVLHHRGLGIWFCGWTSQGIRAALAADNMNLVS
jgi:hypothetical protein